MTESRSETSPKTRTKKQSPDNVRFEKFQKIPQPTKNKTKKKQIRNALWLAGDLGRRWVRRLTKGPEKDAEGRDENAKTQNKRHTRKRRTRDKRSFLIFFLSLSLSLSLSAVAVARQKTTENVWKKNSFSSCNYGREK